MPFETATGNDLPRLTELLSEPPDASRTADGVAYALAHPERGAILVTREGGRVIGCAYLTLTISTAEGGPVAVLQNFKIDAEYRGRGIGSRLLGDVFEYVRENRLLRITLWTETLDDRSREFFRKRGFSDSAMIPLRQPIAENSLR